MYSAYKLNKQGDNIQPWRTSFPIWNQSVVPCPILTVTSWPAYKFLRRQVRWSGILISFRMFKFVVIHTAKGFGIVKKAEIDVFLELSCFFDNPMDVGNLISGSSAFSKTSLNIWKFTSKKGYFPTLWLKLNLVLAIKPSLTTTHLANQFEALLNLSSKKHSHSYLGNHCAFAAYIHLVLIWYLLICNYVCVLASQLDFPDKARLFFFSLAATQYHITR